MTFNAVKMNGLRKMRFKEKITFVQLIRLWFSFAGKRFVQTQGESTQAKGFSAAV